MAVNKRAAFPYKVFVKYDYGSICTSLHTQFFLLLQWLHGVWSPFFLVHYSLFTNEISHFDAAFYFNLDFWRVFFSSLTFSVSCFVCHRLWLVVLCLSFFEKILLTIFYLNVACVVICLRLLTLPFYIKEIMCTTMQNIFLFFVVYHLINAYVR